MTMETTKQNVDSELKMSRSITKYVIPEPFFVVGILPMAVSLQEKAKAKKDPLTCHKELATTEPWCMALGESRI